MGATRARRGHLVDRRHLGVEVGVLERGGVGLDRLNELFDGGDAIAVLRCLRRRNPIPLNECLKLRLSRGLELRIGVTPR